MTLRERVIAYCKYKNMAISRFEKNAGLSNGYFNQVKERPSDEKLDKIKSAFPDFNTDWLLTGKGEMIRPNTIIQRIGDNSAHNTQVVGGSELAVCQQKVEYLERLLEEKERMIQVLLEKK